MSTEDVSVAIEATSTVAASVAAAEPRTYSDALPVAERLEIHELRDALTDAKSFTVLKHRCPRRLAHVVGPTIVGTPSNSDRPYLMVSYVYCNRKGDGCFGSEFISRISEHIGQGVVFHLYNQGRFVTLEAAEN